MSKDTSAKTSSPTDAEELPALPSEWTKPPDMPWFIPNDKEQGVYRFILASAKRARQLQAGARPLISSTSRKPTKIAMDEIRTGAVEVEIHPDGHSSGPRASYASLDLPKGETTPTSSAVKDPEPSL